MEMSSVHCLKKFVNERLIAAADEIFGVFEKTLSVYDEEICRQRRLLDIVLKPEIKLQRASVPQPSISMEEDLLDLPQSDRERSISLEQEDPKPPLIKEELHELSTSQEREIALEQDTEAFKLSPTYDESEHSKGQTLFLDQTQSAAENKLQSNISDEWMQSEFDRKYSVTTEPQINCDQHVRTGESKHMCTLCGKSFKVKRSLKFHMKLHTGEQLYCCKYCGKEFAFSSSMSRHIRVHTGEKPYECRLCGKRFNVSTTLKVHYRIHTGEKPYKCDTCERAFTTCSNLKKHMSLHIKVGNSRQYEKCC